VLWSWGPLQFDVVRANIHEWQHATSADWAKHDVLGAPVQLEYTGAGLEELVLRGRVFPAFLRNSFQGPSEGQNGRTDGLSELEAIDKYREGGTPQQMIRGDGVVMGWFVLEHYERQHTFLDAAGRGKIVGFQGRFSRFPGKPQPHSFYQSLFGMGG